MLETQEDITTLHPLGLRELADEVADVRDPHVAIHCPPLAGSRFKVAVGQHRGVQWDSNANQNEKQRARGILLHAIILSVERRACPSLRGETKLKMYFVIQDRGQLQLRNVSSA